MSDKCKYCKERIFDEDGQSYGTMLSNGEWVCYDDGCLVDCITEQSAELADKNLVIEQLQQALHVRDTQLSCLRRIEAAYNAAVAYIDVNVCDQDTNRTMWLAWNKYLEAKRALESE